MVLGDHAVGVPEFSRSWLLANTLVRQDAPIEWSSGQREVLPGLTLVQCGGHFEGSAVPHWADGAGGRGAIMAGDTISVVQDRSWVTFMRSYPNYIPLSEAAVRQIVAAVQPLAFDVIYGGWWTNDVIEGGKAVIERSAERYSGYINGRSNHKAQER